MLGLMVYTCRASISNLERRDVTLAYELMGMLRIGRQGGISAIGANFSQALVW